MTAYALIDIEVMNADGFGPYIEEVSNTIAKHGGKYLVRGGQVEVVEGSAGEYPMKVVLQFPSMELAKRWYNSEDYQAILPYRLENSRGNFIWVEGA